MDRYAPNTLWFAPSPFAIKAASVLVTVALVLFVIGGGNPEGISSTGCITQCLSGPSSGQETFLLTGGAWTPHDLRRTASTLVTRLATKLKPSSPGIMAKKILSHVSPNKMQRIYDKCEYDDIGPFADFVGQCIKKQMAAISTAQTGTK